MISITKRLKQNKNTCLFLIFFLLAGVCYLLSRPKSAFVSALMFSANFMIYAGLLLFWMQSVRVRLLPTKVRSYIIVSAFLMLFTLMLRTFKYRIVADDPAVTRYAVYAYWLPELLIPSLFLMTALRIQRGGERNGQRSERLVLLPTLLLCMTVMTNDLHKLTYRPKTALASFAVASGTYSYGVVFYVINVWMYLLMLLGVVILIRAARRQASGVMWKVLAVLTVWIVYELILALIFDRYDLPRMYQSLEIRCFGMLAIYEICIRSHLIPHNENYIGFFEKLTLPVLITDKTLTPVFRSAIPIKSGGDALHAAVNAPFYPDADTRLSGMALEAGYAFWTEDETEIHRERRRLAAAHELLSEENDLIKIENELKQKKARLDAKTSIYAKIAAEIYPKQKQIEELLEHSSPDAADYRAVLARCCMLNAWSKRKSNLLLLSETSTPQSNRELFLALQESVRFLKNCGAEAAVVGEEYADFPLPLVHALYDTFETIIEAFLPCLRRMTVSLTADGIRMAMETENEPPLPETQLPVTRSRSDGLTFLTVSARKGGA